MRDFRSILHPLRLSPPTRAIISGESKRLGQVQVINKRSHNHQTIFPIIAFALLAAAQLACKIDLGGPEALGAPIGVIDGSAEEWSDSWKQAIDGAADSGEIIVAINEAQLTSLIANRLKESDNPVLISPQVFLRDQAIHIYGYTEQGVLRASVLITVAPVIDADGKISFELTGAEVGPIPAPEGVKDAISAILTEGFTGPIGTLATGIRVTSLEIDDGIMTIVGEIR